MTTRRVGVLAVVIVCLGTVAVAQQDGFPLKSWSAPPYWLPASGAPGAVEAVDQAVEPVVVRALPLVAIAPCRLLDTRGEGLAALLAGVGQEIGVVGRCGIPAQAQGVSLRLVVAESSGGGQVILGVAGESGAGAGRLVLDPGASGVTTGVVGLDGSGRLVATTGGGSAHVIVEVNGYYAAEPAVRSLNAVAGDVTIEAGENIEITTEGSTVTIAVVPAGSPGADRPGEQGQPVPGPLPEGRRVVRALPSQPARVQVRAQAMTPPSSSMYVAGALGMPDTTALGAGVLILGGDSFLHNYGPAADAGNTFVGQQAGNFTMGGTGSQGKHNTGFGYGALVANTTGYHNTASGYDSLSSNTTGYANTASGTSSLSSNTTGHENTASGAYSLSSNTTGFDNTASGTYSLDLNTTGNYNTASGYASLYPNTTGYYNTANGAYSLYSNTTGYLNTASGASSLDSNTTGSQNTASGYSAGDTNTTGNYNTFVGASSDAAANNLTNATAIGNGAIVNASNKVRIGNASVTVIEGQVAWSYPSDVRLKEAIRDLELGLDFVLGLRPVAFQMKRGNGRTDMGFLAQDIETLIGDGYNLVGIGQDAERTLSLRATDLLAPLVKAVQEQQELIENQRVQIQAQQAEMAVLKDQVEQLARTIAALDRKAVESR